MLKRLKFDLTEVKFASGAPEGTFSGYGAMFGNEDSHGDVIQNGAFKKSLDGWKVKGKLPPMLLQHGGGFMGGADDLLPVGKWTAMSEDAKGLRVEGKLIALGTDRGQYLYEGLKEGAFNGMSIGFRTRQYIRGTKPNEPERVLTEIDLVEVSLVTFPSNDKALVGSVKSMTMDQLRGLEASLREAGCSRKEAAKLVACFKKVMALSDQRDADESEEETRDADPNAKALTEALSGLKSRLAPKPAETPPGDLLGSLSRLKSALAA